MAFFKRLVMAFWILLLPDEVFTGSDNGMWLCKDGRHEIQETWRCDSHIDCSDGSDESPEHCPARECEFDEFKCKHSGACIPSGLLCNGEYDCFMDDMSDESVEFCPEIVDLPSAICDFAKEMRCDTSHCIPLAWRCDSEEDCFDGTDELNCGGCSHGNVSCGDTTGAEDCIDHRWLCDGEEDCRNGSDEQNCSTTTVTTTRASICKLGEFMCKNGTCLPVRLACDKSYDCKDGEDEGFCYLKTCITRSNPASWHMTDIKFVCDQGCKQTPQGPKCFCFPGYTLEPDGIRCRTSGSAVPELFFASNNKILQLKMSSSAPVETIAAINYHDKNAQIFAVDYDHEQNALLWTDHTAGKIHILDRTKHSHILAKVHGIYGLARDWVTHNTYVTYKYEHDNVGHVALIAVENTSAGIYKVMKHKFEHIHVAQPMSIAVDPNTRRMVIADSGNAVMPSSLMLVDMDGRNTSSIVTRHVSKIHAVTIDYITNIGYWSESNLIGAQIWMIKFDSLVRKLLISSRVGDITFSNPFSISVFEDKLYLSDNRTREIWRVDSLNGKPKGYLQHRHSAILKASQSLHLLGIRITHPTLQRKAENPCSTAGCSHFCALRPGGFRCLCPQGLVLEGMNCNEPPPPKKSSNSQTENNKIKPRFGLPTTSSKSKNGGRSSKLCSPPPLVHVTSASPVIQMQKFDVGIALHYHCRKGFHVKGSAATFFNITCKTGGIWEPIHPVCIKFTCADLNCGETGTCKTLARNGAICECRDGNLTYSACSEMSIEALPNERGSGAITAILVTLLSILVVVGLVLWRCMKKREFSRTKHNPIQSIYTRPVNTSTPTKCSDRVGYLPSYKDQTGISNPNYLPKKKVLALPKDINDSGVERSTSSLSSGDSPGVYHYTSLQQTSDAALCTDQDDNVEDLQPSKDKITGVRSTLASIFALKRTESQEQMLPPT